MVVHVVHIVLHDASALLFRTTIFQMRKRNQFKYDGMYCQRLSPLNLNTVKYFFFDFSNEMVLVAVMHDARNCQALLVGRQNRIAT